VLEHIPNPEVFLRSLRRSSGFHPDAVFYFEVPNTDWILDEMRIWDVIYPHCSYFTASTLTDLFRRCGFSVLRTGTGFSDQFLFIEALPKRAEDKVKVLPQHDTRFLANRTVRLRNGFDSTVGYWEQYLGERLAAGHRIAIWGAGAKAVMFLHLVPAARRAQALIDINPAKENTYIPGSCVLIQGPESLREVRPDLVVVLNPVYEAEVREMLASMDLPSEVMSVRDEALPRALRAPAGGAVS
jgi:hypothetical protein